MDSGLWCNNLQPTYGSLKAVVHDSLCVCGRTPSSLGRRRIAVVRYLGNEVEETEVQVGGKQMSEAF